VLEVCADEARGMAEWEIPLANTVHATQCVSSSSETFTGCCKCASGQQCISDVPGHLRPPQVPTTPRARILNAGTCLFIRHTAQVTITLYNVPSRRWDWVTGASDDHSIQFAKQTLGLGLFKKSCALKESRVFISQSVSRQLLRHHQGVCPSHF
jgi:hypothetical protein